MSSTEMTVAGTWRDHLPGVLTVSRWIGLPSPPIGRTYPSSPSVGGSPQSEQHYPAGTGTRVES